jgi:hypothetical protein
MDERAPTYAFDPLERRGLFFGVQPAQVALGAAALLVAWMELRGIAAPAGPVMALVTATGGIAATFGSRDGRTVASWAWLGVQWFLRRLGGPHLSGEPLEGAGTLSRVPATRTRTVVAGLPEGVDVMELPAQPGQAAVGVVVDRASGLLASVVPARGAAFSLLDPEDQARRLGAWRVVLNSLGRPGTPVRRVQWIERSSPEQAAPCAQAAQALRSAEHVAGQALESYLEVVNGAGARSHTHQAWLVVAVAGSLAASGNGRTEVAETMRRELRLLEGQLRHADLWTPGPLDGSALSAMLSSAQATDGVPTPTTRWSSIRPMAEDEGWSCYRMDGCWHATYWIAEWPRIDVGPDFMSPLLLSGSRRAVSLIMEPVPPQRAAREVRSALTSDAAEEQLRAKAGFTPSARRGRETEAAMRREEELADGHAEFRFSGYVTVSASDREELDLACTETEHAAQAAHLEIRRLYGRQREAFTWTLPLARGLR